MSSQQKISQVDTQNWDQVAQNCGEALALDKEMGMTYGGKPYRKK